MNRVSRDNSLKIPKKVDIIVEKINSSQDELEVKKAIATSENKKFNQEQEKIKLEKEYDDFKTIDKIPFNADELMVITVVKKLSAYVILITQKSPKKFRGVFVNRMQNYCLDSLELLLNANFVRMDSIEKKKKREDFQKNAIIKLKMLGYISMLSSNVGCILPKQYKQISIQTAEAINLTAAWKKSDDVRWNKSK